MLLLPMPPLRKKQRLLPKPPPQSWTGKRRKKNRHVSARKKTKLKKTEKRIEELETRDSEIDEE